MDQYDYLEERREARRKRRKREQAVAYITLVLTTLVLVAAIILGAGFLVGKLSLPSIGIGNQENVEESTPDIEDILEEEEGSLEEPDWEAELEEEEIVIPQLTPEEQLDEIVNAVIDAMPLEDKVAGLFFVTPEAITGVNAATMAGDGTRDALAEYAVGGLVYFRKNIETKEQVAEMLSNTDRYSKYPLFFGIDEEGGVVSRMADAGLVDRVYGASAIAETGDPQNAYVAGRTIGSYLQEMGFNVDFAPVADLSNIANSAMKGRTYGATAGVASNYLTEMVRGLNEMDITGCLKHFPGIGSTTSDTHNGMATTNRTREEFEQEEFAMFKAGIDAGARMVMIGHMEAPGLTGDNTPATLSKVIVTDILRNELGFDGVIITDAMNMAAISEYYSADQAAVMALKAGCDMVLMPENFKVAYEGVLEAIKNGTISEARVNDSLRRIYRIKYQDKLEQLSN